MNVGTQRHHKVPNLFADTVSLGAFQIDGNGGGGRLGAQGSGITGNLIPDQSQRILFAGNTGNGKLDHNADDVHENHNNEYLPQNTEDGKSLAGTSHIDEGTADVKRQQGNNGNMQNFVNNGGEVRHNSVETVTNFFAPHGRQTQSHHESQHHCRQGIQNGGNGNGEVRRQGNTCGGSNLCHGVRAHERGEQRRGHQIRCAAGDQSGAIGNGHGDQQQFACTLSQIRNTHGDIGKDHEWDDEFQEIAEKSGQGNYQSAYRLRHKLTDQNT